VGKLWCSDYGIIYDINGLFFDNTTATRKNKSVTAIKSGDAFFKIY